MRSYEIRRRFLDFFRRREHLEVPSSSLVPDDPTLLLTTAGMVQFKPYFLGTAQPPRPRLVSLQKCVRTVDIESIGVTDRHSTCFEMLGNFSFGDYDKTEAVPWAFAFLTDELGLDPDRLWVTVYRDDDETAALWRDVGIPADRVQRLGVADNFWDTGGPGPCGPCSEIFYDRGAAHGPPGGPAVDTDRYLELWNLVFMKHLRGDGAPGDDELPIVGDLPRACLESGLGVERVAVVLQGVVNVHEVDHVAPVLRRLRELVPGEAAGRVRSERIVVDHVRAATFLLADGVLAGNDGRGHVVRRLIRRACHHVALLRGQSTGQVLAELGSTVVDTLGDVWPELVERRGLVEQALAHEEEAFGRTLAHGSRLLQGAIRRTKAQAGSALDGQTAFTLHDRHGFPVELTMEIAREAGLDVDVRTFAALMEEQRQQARHARGQRRDQSGAATPFSQVLARAIRQRFVGYDQLSVETEIVGLLRDGTDAAVASEGHRVQVVLVETPFYAESGGQVGDTGLITTNAGARLRVRDTRLVAGLHVLEADVVCGEVRAKEVVDAAVDAERRAATARSHSATHVLHAVLRELLGDHARQHGSLVAPGRLRFDVTHFCALEPDQLEEIEATVNRRLLADPAVRIWETTPSEAKRAGALAFFGETYGEVVRVVDIGDFSRELCGGTHVGHGSQVGAVRLLGETAVASGVRRIEALTGFDALRHTDHERRLLEEVARLLAVTRPEDIPERLRVRLRALAEAERRLRELRESELSRLADTLAERRRLVDGRWVVCERLSERVIESREDARRLVAAIMQRCPQDQPGGVVLGWTRRGKAQLTLWINEPLGQTGVAARELLHPAGRAVGGGAGGSGPVAHAGGRYVERLDDALALAAHTVLSA